MVGALTPPPLFRLTKGGGANHHVLYPHLHVRGAVVERDASADTPTSCFGTLSSAAAQTEGERRKTTQEMTSGLSCAARAAGVRGRLVKLSLWVRLVQSAVSVYPVERWRVGRGGSWFGEGPHGFVPAGGIRGGALLGRSLDHLHEQRVAPPCQPCQAISTC